MIEWIKGIDLVQFGIFYLLLHTFLKGIAVAIDKDPENDNLFEKIINFMGRLLKYISVGKR